MTEAALMRSVLGALRLKGIWALRLNAGLTVVRGATGDRAIRGVEPGTPDVLVMRPDGRVAWIELKAPKGRLTGKQRDWHERARSLGHTVTVARSVEDALGAVT